MSSRKQTPQMRTRPLRMDNQRKNNQQKRHLRERVINSEEIQQIILNRYFEVVDHV